MFLLSTTWLARVLPTLCTIAPPLTMNSSNTIREKNEMLHMRSKLWCFTRYTSKYLSNYTQPLCKYLQTQEWILSQGDHKEITSNYPWAKIWNGVNTKLSKSTISISSPTSIKTSIYKLASIISKRATMIWDAWFAKCPHIQLRTHFVQVSKQASE
jgi:hypothetical protein